MQSAHDDVIKWNPFPRYWPFVQGIHQSPVNSAQKGQWHGALMFFLICVWINGWVNNRNAGDLKRHRTHYDVIVMCEGNMYWGCKMLMTRSMRFLFVRSVLEQHKNYYCGNRPLTYHRVLWMLDISCFRYALAVTASNIRGFYRNEIPDFPWRICERNDNVYVCTATRKKYAIQTDSDLVPPIYNSQMAY